MVILPISHAVLMGAFWNGVSNPLSTEQDWSQQTIKCAEESNDIIL